MRGEMFLHLLRAGADLQLVVGDAPIRLRPALLAGDIVEAVVDQLSIGTIAAAKRNANQRVNWPASKRMVDNRRQMPDGTLDGTYYSRLNAHRV